jgi:uncharacterized protein (TIGR01777 family)
MKIAISGSTGFIGKHLSEYFLRSGNELITISRNDFGSSGNQLTKIVNSADVIINLAGSSVLCRWNARNKALILSSRVETTRALVRAVLNSQSEHHPKIFLNASAIGIYGNSGMHDEYSSLAVSDFLASVCIAWEKETDPLQGTDVRVCKLRTGIVLGLDGGSLGKMLPLFRAGLGGKIGSGKQSFSFVHILDFCRAIEYFISNEKSMGVYNMVSPEPTTNKLFTMALSRSLHRPALFTVPEFALKLVYGQAAELLTKGASVKPARLLEEGFQFKCPDITSTLTDLV